MKAVAALIISQIYSAVTLRNITVLQYMSKWAHVSFMQISSRLVHLI